MGIIKKIGQGFAAVFFILLVIGMFMDDPSKTPEQKAQEDKQMYSEFYSTMMQKTSEADKVSGAFFESVERGDIISAAQIAMNIKYKMYECQTAIDRISVPKLHNEDAQKDLDQAKDFLTRAYLNKSSFVADFIDFAEDQNMKKVAELKNTSERAQALLVGGLASMLSAGSKLGVNPPQASAKQRK